MTRYSTFLWLAGACLVPGSLLGQTPPPQLGNICFPSEFHVQEYTYLPDMDDLVVNEQYESLSQGRRSNEFTVSSTELVRLVERFDLGMYYIANYLIQPDGSVVLDQCFNSSITYAQDPVCLANPDTAEYRRSLNLGGFVPVDNFYIVDSITGEVKFDVLTTRQGGLDLPLRLLTRDLQGQFVTEYENYEFGPPDPAVFDIPAGCPPPAAAQRMSIDDLRAHLPESFLQRYAHDPTMKRLLASGSEQ